MNPNADLAYDSVEYPFVEEMQEPYDVLLELEDIEMSVGALESVMAYDSFECLDKMRLSEEEEMLLDYLLPNRQARQTSIKGVPYTEFLRNSLRGKVYLMKSTNLLNAIIEPQPRFNHKLLHDIIHTSAVLYLIASQL